MRLQQDTGSQLGESANVTNAIGNYVLGKELGQGSWGTCYRAVDKATKDTVAFRVISSGFSKSELSSLQSAVRYTSGIESPRFQRAVAVGMDPAKTHLVSDFVPGVDLYRLVSRSGQLPIRQSIYCIARAIEGLDAAHKKSIVHGELRPSKIIVDGSGNVAIRDLALAQVTKMRRQIKSDPNYNSTLPKHHIEYTAPEILSGSGKPSFSSDLYSLGCILFFLLTGKPPYPNRNAKAIAKAHLDAAIPQVSRRVKGVLPGVEECLAKMLAKQPGDRFASYKQCHEALREIAKSLPKDDRSTQDQWEEIVDVDDSKTTRMWPVSTSTIPKWLVYSALGLGILIAIGAAYVFIFGSDTSTSKPVDPNQIREVPTAESEDSFELR